MTLQGTTGANNVCVGSNITLTNSTVIPVGATASWTSVAGNATIDSVTGIVTGVSSGVATLKYKIQQSYFCKRDTIFNVTVKPTPSIGT